jgi:DNA sulfur modification protein DndB
MTENDRRAFRELRGVQGQTTRTKRSQKAIQERIPNFNPPGLEKFLQEEKAQTNLKAKEIIDRMETTLQKVILEELRRECGPEDSQWWIIGVPKGVRLDVMKRYEEDDGKRGGKEYYFDLIDYRKIALQNWSLFEPLLAYGKKTEKKEKRTSWMNFVNEKRNISAHSTSGILIPIEDLIQLQEYETWLNTKISGKQESDIGVDVNQ